MDTQYKIIGGDGREYGPVTLDELRSWIRDGRVAGTTAIWKSDPGTWANASTYPELSSELGVTPSHVPASGAPVSGIDAGEERPVGFWARLAAGLIDYFAISLIFGLCWWIITAMMGLPPITPPQPDPNADPLVAFRKIFEFLEANKGLIIAEFFVRKFFAAAFMTFFNGKWGATPGKMALGARIVLLDGTPIGYQVAFLRWLGTQVSGILFGIGYLFIAFRADKRALHDLMVGTKVVYKR